ncbi:peptidylprolyl isomerase [Plasticicumulans acidivorans]|uniref:peptidylprolyl isomerase n=1 Tax=Plasticicumulans acidivorans TaxID=886464 RepID=A0A317MRG9_9GAMM|nr:peptidylprolyl isomerase [Plasticicumulans acidivorans]PWV59465.1 peptidyl-prolyl cis-trans isomerase C [Plasticicumulans acidivorans]
MQIKRFAPAVLGLSLTLALGAAQAEDAPATPKPAAAQPAAQPLPDPVATVNGQPIPKSIFLAYQQQRARQLAATGAGPNAEDGNTQLIDELVMQELLVQKADAEKLAQDPEIAAQLDLLRRNLLATFAVRKYLKTAQPSEADIKAEYDKAVAMMKVKEYKARHILVDDEAKAKSLIEQLNKGAKFEDLAKANSKDGSKDQGGDLGWFTPDMMVEPFAQAVVGLDKGKFTEKPVKTQFGWHVIQLEDSRDKTPPSLDELRPQIAQMLQGKLVNDYLEKLKSEAKIEVEVK